MPLTVAGLVARQELQLTVLAGGSAVDRVIRWAHPIELADPSPWLRGGELLLTTGMGLPLSRAALEAYVDRLADAGIAALGFGVGLRHDRVPQAMVEAAATREIPLLEIPLPVPFIAITEAVAAALAEEQRRVIQQLADAQQAMARAALRHGPAGVLRALRRYLPGDYVVLDRHGGVTASSGQDVAGLARIARDEMAHPRRSPAPFGAALDVNGPRVVLLSLDATRGTQGILAARSHGELGHLGQLALVQANSLLSIGLDRPQAVLDAERRVRADVLRGLLEGVAPVGASTALPALGFPTDISVVAMALASAQPANRTYDAVASVVAEDDLTCLAAGLAGEVLLLLPWTDSLNLDALMERVNRRSRRSVHAGVSAIRGLADARDAVRQARFALRSGRAEDRRVTRFAALSTYTLLLAAHSPESLLLAARAALDPLLDHDLKHGTELVSSLDTLLAHNGQQVPTAKALGIHRHTLRARIDRIAELTGRNLDSAHDRTELWLALKALELAGSEGPDPRAPDSHQSIPSEPDGR